MECCLEVGAFSLLILGGWEDGGAGGAGGPDCRRLGSTWHHQPGPKQSTVLQSPWTMPGSHASRVVSRASCGGHAGRSVRLEPRQGIPCGSVTSLPESESKGKIDVVDSVPQELMKTHPKRGLGVNHSGDLIQSNSTTFH